MKKKLRARAHKLFEGNFAFDAMLLGFKKLVLFVALTIFPFIFKIAGADDFLMTLVYSSSEQEKKYNEDPKTKGKIRENF